MTDLAGVLGGLGLGAAAAIATWLVIRPMLPILEHYALARVNARSSHSVPTPQGGGLAIIVVLVATMIVLSAVGQAGLDASTLTLVIAVVIALGAIGAVDDLRPLPVAPRLIVQIAMAGLLVWTLPAEARVVSELPWVVERGGLIIGLVWFINLTNFMDGIDWMTVVEAVPVGIGLVLIGAMGLAPRLEPALPLLVVLCGCLIGFAPWNRHVARLFLGDVGSLPIGALMGWGLIMLAASGQIAAAMILPLYYLADATITLVRRFLRGERISEAHRSHFYQTATKRGYAVPQVTRLVLALNTVLIALAVVAAQSSVTGSGFCLLAALALTAAVLVTLERGRLA